MKIKSVKVLGDGLSENRAERIWEQTEANANYQFNRSHAIEYSIVSYWTMWLRVRYPAEYFAACMSIVKEDKLPGLVGDAREAGIQVLPPDINLSSDKFTILNDKTILAPFSSVKGVSEITAQRIVELRSTNRGMKVGRQKKKRDGTTEDVFEVDFAAPIKGKFSSLEEFTLVASMSGSKINSRVVEALNAVGAFSSIEPTQKSPTHIDRRKDQTLLMPGLIIDSIKSERSTDVSEPFLRAKIIRLVQEYRKCEDCSLAGQPHPPIRMKSNVKFMVVQDCPTWQDEKKDKLLEGDSGNYVKASIKTAGLEVGDGYYTTIVKAKKNDKFLSNEQINGCSKFFERELELIKPAVIVALGSASIKKLLPGLKSSPAELAGKVIYDEALDAQIVCGINPAQCAFDPSKTEILDGIFSKVAEIVS